MDDTLQPAEEELVKFTECQMKTAMCKNKAGDTSANFLAIIQGKSRGLKEDCVDGTDRCVKPYSDCEMRAAMCKFRASGKDALTEAEGKAAV